MYAAAGDLRVDLAAADRGVSGRQPCSRSSSSWPSPSATDGRGGAHEPGRARRASPSWPSLRASPSARPECRAPWSRAGSGQAACPGSRTSSSTRLSSCARVSSVSVPPGCATCRAMSASVRHQPLPTPCGPLASRPRRGRVRSTWRAEPPVPSSPRGDDRRTRRRARVTTTAPVVARATGALAPGLLATQVWRHRVTTAASSSPRAAFRQPTRGSSEAAPGLAHRTPRREQPGANAVTVAFDVFGRRGPVVAAEGRSISIPPRARRRLARRLGARRGVPGGARHRDGWCRLGRPVRPVDRRRDGARHRRLHARRHRNHAGGGGSRCRGDDLRAPAQPVDGGEALVQVTVLTEQGPAGRPSCVRSGAARGDGGRPLPSRPAPTASAQL